MKDYKSIQMLASISMIGGPLSLLFGGVLLSTAALVCGIIALVLLRSARARAAGSSEEPIAQNLMRQSVIGLAVSAIALVLNAAALATVMPAMMEALQTGDPSALMNGGSEGASSSSGAFDAASGPSSQSSGSIWG